ncbi:hypothetical protein GCM10023222_26000 [Saccharopolyspora cebuensis]
MLASIGPDRVVGDSLGDYPPAAPWQEPIHRPVADWVATADTAVHELLLANLALTMVGCPAGRVAGRARARFVS